MVGLALGDTESVGTELGCVDTVGETLTVMVGVALGMVDPVGLVLGS